MMTNVLKFPPKGRLPSTQPTTQGPYFCGKPMKAAKPTPKRVQPMLVQDAAKIYSEIPADLGRGEAAFIYISTVLQFSRQIIRELSVDDLEMLSALVESAGDVRAEPDWSEIDILVDLIDSEYARRYGSAV